MPSEYRLGYVDGIELALAYIDGARSAGEVSADLARLEKFLRERVAKMREGVEHAN